MWIDMRRVAALSMGISQKSAQNVIFSCLDRIWTVETAAKTQHSDTLCGSTESLLG